MRISFLVLFVSLALNLDAAPAAADPIPITWTITAIEFSPDGKYLLVGNSRGAVGLFDVQQKKWSSIRFEGLGHTRNGEACTVLAATFSPDGNTAVSGGHDGTIRFWDLGTGKELRRIRTDFFCVSCLSFSKDGKYLLSAEKNLYLRDGATGEEIRFLPSGPVVASALSPDGRLALSAGESFITVWDTSTAKQVRQLKTYTPRQVFQLGFSPGGDRVICAGGGVTVWDLSTGDEIRDIRSRRLCESACFIRTGRFVLMATMGEAPRLVELSTGKEALSLKDNLSSYRLVAVSPNGKHAASAQGGILSLWDLNSGRQLWISDPNIRPRVPNPEQGNHAGF